MGAVFDRYERLKSTGVRVVTKYHVIADGSWSVVDGPVVFQEWRLKSKIESEHISAASSMRSEGE